jgi:hypothetical protein
VGPVHAIVEGPTERTWVRELVPLLLGFEPDGLVITNLRGVGAAKTLDEIIETIADYATDACLLVDSEGDMAKIAAQLVEQGLLDERNLLLVDSSFEEANFSDGELTSAARRIARDPPGNRPKVKIRLTAKQLRARHIEKLASAKPGEAPGLAETLLEMLRDPAHGPVNIKKTELSDELLRTTIAEIQEAGTIKDIERRRPIVRFVAARIASPLGAAAFR